MPIQKDPSYLEIVNALKDKIRVSKIKLALSINIHLLAIYWEIGNTIADQENKKGWGAKVVDQLAKDLRSEFSDFKGLSPRNLRYMRDFSQAWPELSILQQIAAKNDNPLILQQPVAKLPWGHICLILDKLKTREERHFYASRAVDNSWSRSILLNQIESNLSNRRGKLQNNFSSTLPDLQSDLAKDLFQDPYKFDFLQLSESIKERDLENALVNHMSRFLIELGKGFAYVGRQVHIEDGGKDYYLDLLFFHLKLHCYVVMELKIGEFVPEFAGKMNFYLSLVDDRVKSLEDKPSIGIILCKNKDKTTVEYALRDLGKPIGIAEYQLTQAIPEALKRNLPTIEELEQEVAKEISIATNSLDEKVGKLKELLKQLNNPIIEKVKSKDVIRTLFINVIQQLYLKTNTILEEILPLFSTGLVTVSINEKPHMTSIDLDAYLLKKIDIYSIGVSIHLEGFRNAGINAFSIHEHFTLQLDKFNYQFGQHRDDKWGEKTYDETWGEEELNGISRRFAEIAISKIIAELKNIT